MWTYHISTGVMLDKNGKQVAKGYSGKGSHKNVVADTHIVNEGPLPIGIYKINAPRTSAKTGPYAMDLTPDANNKMFGRGSFQIHGDSVKNPGTASSGCIIMPRNIRELIWNSNDHDIEVKA